MKDTEHRIPSWKLAALANLNPELVSYRKHCIHSFPCQCPLKLCWNDTKKEVTDRELDYLMRVILSKMSIHQKREYMVKLHKGVLGNKQEQRYFLYQFFDSANTEPENRMDTYLMTHGVEEPK